MSAPACTPHDVGITFDIDGGTTPASIRDALALYFAHFDAPRRREPPGGIMLGTLLCACGKGLDGFLGTATWGMAHGEMFCGACKRPGRAHHFIKEHDTDPEPFITIHNLPLLYRLDDAGT